MPGGVMSRRRRHARKPGVIYNIQGGLDVFADNRSGCIRRPQVWMYSPTTGLDVFADNRSRCDAAASVPGAVGVRDRIRARARSRSPAPATQVNVMIALAKLV